MQALRHSNPLDREPTSTGVRRANGFTFVELILTIAVLAIMATLAAPFILTASRSLTMSRGAREIQAALLQARAVAIVSRQNICFQPVAGGYAYRKVTCAGTPWTGPNTNATGVFRPADNVTLGNAGGPATFTPFGTASATTVITVSVTGGSSTTVTVQPSGRVTIP